MIPTAMILSAVALAAVGGGTGVYVDLLNLQWWQAVLGIGAALGVSGAPWLTALAAGRLLFRADLDRQLKKSDEEHAKAMAQQKDYYEALREIDKQHYGELKESNIANAIAAQTERKRADDVTDAVLEVGAVLEANTHALNSFHRAVEIAQSEAGS
ncbi:MAG: hypothetical protein K0S70_123 [Microbacterium sp.]|jgi:hypothetical protein|nr:hypothetical protein [Microbacterium sp.]